MKSISRMTSNGGLRSGVHVMSAALGLLLVSPTFASVTAKGSRVCDDNRGVLEDPDVTHQLGNVAVQLIYAAGVDQGGGDWFTTAQDHTLQYREYPDGTFADVPVTTNPTGPFIPASGTILADDVSVSDTNRRANTDPTGYKAGAKQFQGSNLHNYNAQVKNQHTEAQWALEFTNCPDGTKYEFRVRWGTKQGDAFVTYPAQVWTPLLELAEHDAGQQPDDFFQLGGETDAELFGFKLDPGANTINVTEIIFRLSNIVGLTNADFQGLELVEDSTPDGDIDNGTETNIMTGTWTKDLGAGKITWSGTFSVTAATHYILRADFASLSEGDTVTISLDKGDITAAKPVTGSAGAATHQELTSSQAPSFYYIDPPVQVTPVPAATWTPVDVSAQVPVGATGVILNFVSSSLSDVAFGLQQPTSTDNRTDIIYSMGQCWSMVGVDSDRIFEAYIQNTTNTELWLVGYTTSGVTFFTNAKDKSLTALNAWTDIDISADTGTDTAIGAIVEIDGAFFEGFGLQMNGSTDNRTLHGRHVWAIIGVDNAEIFEGFITNTNVDFFLVGYVTAGATFFLNAKDKSLGTAGTWQDIDISANTVTYTANGAFIEVFGNGADTHFGLRKKGWSGSIWRGAGTTGEGHLWGIVEVDANEVLEGYVIDLANDFYVVGYSHVNGGKWMETGSYTGNSPSSQSITGVGFQPQVVFVKKYPANKYGYVRTATMPSGLSKKIHYANPLEADQIQSLDPDGFTVGSGLDVNASGDTGYWIAFRSAPGTLKVGTYPGTGVTKSISGVGFQPNVVMVFPDGGTDVSCFRTSTMPDDTSAKFDTAPNGELSNGSNWIKLLESDGFQVGTNPKVNMSGITYHYVAFKTTAGQVEVGTYGGDGSNDHDIPVSFEPKYVIVYGDDPGLITTGGSHAIIHRPDSMVGNISLNMSWGFGSDSFVDTIKALRPTGFKVGSDVTVNQIGTTYHWMAFGDSVPAGPPPPLKPKIIKWVEVDPYGP